MNQDRTPPTQEQEVERERREITEMVESVKRYLSRWYGVNDLSIFEVRDLYRIARVVMRQFSRDQKTRQEIVQSWGKVSQDEYFDSTHRFSAGAIPDPKKEIIFRWLSEILGENISDSVLDQHKNVQIKYRDNSGNQKEVQVASPLMAEHLIRQLRQQGIQPPIITEETTDPAFIEYINRVRERMHNPELEPYHPPKEKP